MPSVSPVAEGPQSCGDSHLVSPVSAVRFLTLKLTEKAPYRVVFVIARSPH